MKNGLLTKSTAQNIKQSLPNIIPKWSLGNFSKSVLQTTKSDCYYRIQYIYDRKSTVCRAQILRLTKLYYVHLRLILFYTTSLKKLHANQSST